MGARSRTKGKRGELEVAQLLRDHGIAGARRGQQFSGEPGNPDVVGLHGIHLEIKRSERFLIWPSISQARREALEGDIATVWHRANGRPWIVVMEASDFLSMYRAMIAQAAPKED